ncbi:MAG: hypothetical protein J3Q66DRAFT_428923 [Benniella sp.]|nr:MAG: hypothetical protein J3Q66DRAFT_428923 [Benniella sp.]
MHLERGDPASNKKPNFLSNDLCTTSIPSEGQAFRISIPDHRVAQGFPVLGLKAHLRLRRVFQNDKASFITELKVEQMHLEADKKYAFETANRSWPARRPSIPMSRPIGCTSATILAAGRPSRSLKGLNGMRRIYIGSLRKSKSPPPEPIPGQSHAFRVTVWHKDSPVLGLEIHLYSEELVFPVGSSIVDGVVQLQEEMRRTYNIEQLQTETWRFIDCPLKFNSHCTACIHEHQPDSVQKILKRLSEWEGFVSRESILQTMLTVLAKGVAAKCILRKAASGSTGGPIIRFIGAPVATVHWSKAAFDAHVETHRPYKCHHPGCGAGFTRPQGLKRHEDIHQAPPKGEVAVVCPPPEPIPGHPNAFRVTVWHKGSPVLGLEAHLHSEELIFPAGSSVVNGVVQCAGEIATPLAWLDDLVDLTGMQKTSYIHIVKHDYRIDSPFQGKSCIGEGCDSQLSWRNSQVQESKGRLYVYSSDTCYRCHVSGKGRDRREKLQEEMRRTYDIKGDLLPGLIEKLAPGNQVPAYAMGYSCIGCSVPLDRSNTRLDLGSSVAAPLKLHGRCTACIRTHRSDPVRKIEKRLSEWDGFVSREVTLQTMLTVFVNGFAPGPAKYDAAETARLRALATTASPQCFWTGLQLSMDSHIEPNVKFSFDRTTFVNGRALEYGSSEQVIVAASLLANCFFGARDPQQRAAYLDRLEQDWESGITWADSAILQLQQGYDADAEQTKAWTPEWEVKWKQFVQHKESTGHQDRIQWSKWEWRFFHETCEGRSLVTGQRLVQHAHIDRIFNTDGYHLSNCILVEGEINFAKSTMPQFASSAAFDGPCKISYAIDVLRTAVTELLDLTRPHRVGLNNKAETSRLRTLARKAVPRYFRTGLHLSIDNTRTKFALGKITFDRTGKRARGPEQRAAYLNKIERDWNASGPVSNSPWTLTLSRGSSSHLTERPSSMGRFWTTAPSIKSSSRRLCSPTASLEHSIQAADNIPQQYWESGITWADSVIHQGCNVDVEQEKAWTPEWEVKWKQFIQHKESTGHKDRYSMDQMGVVILSQGLRQPGEINFAKSTMPQFASSAAFDGPCKISYAIDVLRTAVTELLDLTRPHRAGWTRRLRELSD